MTKRVVSAKVRVQVQAPLPKFCPHFIFRVFFKNISSLTHPLRTFNCIGNRTGTQPLKNNPPLQLLYRRFMANQCSAEEMEQVFESLHDSGNEALFRKLVDANFEKEMAGGAQTDAATTNRIRQRILVGMAARSAEKIPAQGFARQLFLRVAAISVLGLLLGAAAYFVYAPQAKPTAAYVQSIVPNGKKMTVRLADGTHVWLNAGSRFRYPKSFASATRRVFLEGEAYFEVMPDQGKPFMITSGSVTTTVLGTSFNVKAHPADSTVEVAVLTGRVSVKADSTRQTVLLPAQKAVYDLARNELRVEKARNPADYAAWREGGIILESVRMDGIARMLERKYGVTVRFANPATKNCRVTAKFGNVPLAKVLFAVCGAAGATYKTKGNRVVIKGKGCKLL